VRDDQRPHDCETETGARTIGSRLRALKLLEDAALMSHERAKELVAHDEALAQLTDNVKRNGEVDADIAYSIASVYALEGLRSEAFAWLARAIALGNENRPCFDNDPTWTGLREEPEFLELMTRVRHKPTPYRSSAEQD